MPKSLALISKGIQSFIQILYLFLNVQFQIIKHVKARHHYLIVILNTLEYSFMMIYEYNTSKLIRDYNVLLVRHITSQVLNEIFW